MANHCGYCDTRRPEPTVNYPDGTKLMQLGDNWHEFCENCGNDPQYSLTNTESGERATLEEVFEMIGIAQRF